MRYVPSPTVRSMVVYGASGLAFAGANLLLARVLSTEHYALLTLLVALNTLSYHLAPIGLDGVVSRGQVTVGAMLLKRAALATTLAAAATAVAAAIAYGFSLGVAALIFMSTVAGGLMLVAAAQFQSEQRFGLSLTMVNSPNLLLLLGALTTLVPAWRTATLPFAILAVGLVLAAAVSWLLALRLPRRAAATPIPWGEASALAGVAAAGMLLIQLERLVIPYLLPLADLARFGVLAAIAGSLFRLLQMAVGFTLLPRLRKAATVFERRRLIGHELRFAVVIAVLGASAILVLTPLVERWLLAGKYDLSLGLVLAVLFSGIAKIAHAFAKAAATALATPRELAFVNGAGWISATLAVGSAVIGAQWWGLAGVIYGVGVGWIAWAALSFALVVRHLRLPDGVPAET